jgi:DNA-binding CsgD family transcriptional regulator/tetratricopeptide (TPR) repeat protein
LPTGGTAEDLFIERARLADATLELGDRDSELVEAVCAGLDGMPLGIELAAASLRSLALSDVVARLSQSLDAFESPLRDAPARQRNLRAAIQWSYDLLDEGERLLFQRLAVFSGGWRLDSAEEVCSGEGVERREVLRLHRSLVEQGLVDFNPDKGRYRLLEPIREFAAELLGSDSPWHERHAASFASMAERLTGDFHSPPRDAQARLREEDANLLKAAEWSYRSAQLEAGLRIVAASARHWRVRGGSRWLAPAARLTSHPDAKAYGELWALARLRTLSLEFFGDGREFEVIASLRQVADTLSGSEHQAEAWIELGLRLAGIGQTDEAMSLLEQGHSEAREREDAALRMHALHGLTAVAERTGDSQSQRRYTEEMLWLARKMDNPFLFALALRKRAEAHGAVGQIAEAEVLLREGQQVLHDWEDGAAGPADPGGPLATLMLLQGRYGEASDVLRTTLVRALRSGETYSVPLLVGGQGIAVGLSGSPGLGTRLLTASLAETNRRAVMVAAGLRAQLEGSLKVLERAAGPSVFRDEVAKGEALSLMDSVELALSTTVAPEVSAAVTTRHPAGLTAREVEILRLLAAGNTNRQIAAQLVLSLRTVETHIFNVYSKTNTGGRAAATGWAIANGIYEPTT